MFIKLPLFCLLLELCVVNGGPFSSRFTSPLDEPDNEKEDADTWSFPDQYAHSMPDCEVACADHVLGALQMFFTAGNISTTKEVVCKHYRDAEQCMGPLTHCKDSLFPVVTSGIRFMCVDQKEAFDVLIECVDWNSPIVKKDCDMQCQPQSLATGIALKDTVMKSLDQPIVNQAVNMRNLIEPHIGRIMFSEGCRITECLLKCYKTKFNMLCEGTAGSLIMEVLSRPLSHHEAPIGTQFLSAFVGGLLPHTCSFLSSSNQLSLRIDPELNSEIKRMYKGRKKLSEMETHLLGKPVDIINPFDHVPSPFVRSSPLEDQYNIEEDLFPLNSAETISVSLSTANLHLPSFLEQRIRVDVGNSSPDEPFILECVE